MAERTVDSNVGRPAKFHLTVAFCSMNKYDVRYSFPMQHLDYDLNRLAAAIVRATLEF